MCRNCPFESMLHLFFLCPIVVEIWSLLRQHYHMEFFTPGLSTMLITQQGYQKAKAMPRDQLSLRCTILLAGCRQIWKQRNSYIFDTSASQYLVPVPIIVDRICVDVSLWTRCCWKVPWKSYPASFMVPRMSHEAETGVVFT
jgi:hypothetical protein